MKCYKNISFIVLVLLFISFAHSCQDLTELNNNPNGVTGDKANADLILSTVLTNTATAYTNLGYQDAAGVMQHTQKDAWLGEHNNYEWSPRDWGEYYDILRNNQLVFEKAEENDLNFHQGVSLVMKSFVYAQITDLWGDAPYSNALNGDLGGEDNNAPAYDTQEDIYNGILADLEEANSLLSETGEIFPETEDADVIYNGDPDKWRKFANSLRLRYLMRVSERRNVEQEFVSIVQNEPVFESNDDNALMNFPGSNEVSSWPKNTVYDGTDGSDFRRIRPAATLVEALREKNDPRIGVWFAKVNIPTEFSDDHPHNEIIDGIRYLDDDQVNSTINTNPDYVGIPPQITAPSGFNMNPNPGQTSNNPFVSYLNDRYRDASGPLLNARLMTYAELNFILAEASLKGWEIGAAEGYYDEGVRASLNEWEVGDSVEEYLNGSSVSYDGSLERIMEQKWIASWTAAQEAWFDYRRTGFPDLQTGPAAPREALPLRFPYGSNELNFNRENVSSAIQRLESTQYSQGEDNSLWARPWLLQGSDVPYH